MVHLETKSLIFRELTSADASAILRFANDESINRYLAFGSLATKAGAEEYVSCAIAAAQSASRSSYKLAMSISSTRALSGSCWLDIED